MKLLTSVSDFQKYAVGTSIADLCALRWVDSNFLEPDAPRILFIHREENLVSVGREGDAINLQLYYPDEDHAKNAVIQLTAIKEARESASETSTEQETDGSDMGGISCVWDEAVNPYGLINGMDPDELSAQMETFGRVAPGMEDDLEAMLMAAQEEPDVQEEILHINLLPFLAPRPIAA